MSNRTIFHADGDSFFASCFVSLHPELRGRPVVTGRERGIASAMSAEAKRAGVTRGMPIWKVREICPDAAIVSSDYKLYMLFQSRMAAIVRRHASSVEVYSIDECFADITEPFGGLSPAEAARRIKDELENDLGMTFSVGCAPTKSLAKVASSHDKPGGYTVLRQEDIGAFLGQVAIEDVWGIGRRMAPRFRAFGVMTALDFISQPEAWVAERLSLPYLELWHELRGSMVRSVRPDRGAQKSVMRTRMFSGILSDKEAILAELSKNTEHAARKLRRLGLYARSVSFFLKTDTFRYHGLELDLPEATQVPEDIIRSILPAFSRVHRKGVRYRAAGVTLSRLASVSQGQLFAPESSDRSGLYRHIDALGKKYGKPAVWLGSSMPALGRYEKADEPHLLCRKDSLRPLDIPLMGEAS